MPVPDYQTVMLPLLRLAASAPEHRFRDAVEALADEFSLTPEERSELLPSGQQPVFSNRVGWANTYLKQAGLLEGPRRGVFRPRASLAYALAFRGSLYARPQMGSHPSMLGGSLFQTGSQDMRE